ncbi:MAG: arylsulfatase, partial [Pseudomonadota bacterium]
APFRLFKTFPTEGGTRTPALISGPGLVPGGLGTPRSEAFATVRDITPTLLELAGITHPGTRYGNRVVTPMSGTSLVPFLLGEAPTAHDPDVVVGQELFGRRALRRGNWKALWLGPPYGEGQWQLFDLATDHAESKDLADTHPEVLASLLVDWARFREANRVILPAKDAGYANEDSWQ